MHNLEADPSEECGHFKDECWLAQHVEAPSMMVVEKFNQLRHTTQTCSAQVSAEITTTASTQISTEITTTPTQVQTEIGTTSTASRALSIRQPRRCGKCREIKNKNHRCPLSIPPSIIPSSLTDDIQSNDPVDDVGLLNEEGDYRRLYNPSALSFAIKANIYIFDLSCNFNHSRLC